MDVPAMRASFAKAAAAGDEAPLYFYSWLFLNHPEIRRMFPVSMMHQRDQLFAALGTAVTRIDDLDSLVPVLERLGRDHRKFRTLPAHYPALGASLLATLEHFDDGWNDELAASWTAAYDLVADVMIRAAAEVSTPAWWEAEVVSHERRTRDVAVLRLQPRVPLDYLPGQSITLEMDLRPRLWRFFSLATAPRPDGVLEIHVQARDGGPVSSALVRQVAIGDVVRLGPPEGEMVLDTGSDRDLLMVAGDTGVALMKALIDQVARDGPARRVDLFVGARTEAALYDRADLQRLQQEHPWLTVTSAVSEDETSALEHGAVADVVIRHGPWASRDAYVAGAGGMVDDTVARLVGHGLPERRIRSQVLTPSRSGPGVDEEVAQ